MRTKLIGIALLSLLFLTASKCQLTREEFDQVITAIPLPVTPQVYERRESPMVGSIINEDGVKVPTTNEAIKAQRKFADFVVLQPNEGEVWPGNVVQSSGLAQGLLNPIGLDFTGREITVDVPRLNATVPSYTRTVDNASYGVTLDTLGSILRNLPTTTPADMTFEGERIYSSDHALFKAGLKADWPGGKLSAMLGTVNSEVRTNMLYKYDQVYYHASAKRPRSPSSFLKDGVKLDQIRNYISEDNPPAYVSSVTYGRRIYVHVQSSQSEQEVRQVFDFAFSAFKAGVDAHLNSQQQKVYNDSRIRVIVVGGGAEAGTRLVEKPSFDELAKVIKEGANFSNTSPAKPLSYTVRYLRDNSVAAVGIPGEWTNVKETPPNYRKPFRATFVKDGFVFTDTADDDEDLDWVITLKAHGQNDEVLETFVHSIQDREVFQYGKDESIACKNNCFYVGESLYVNKPVFKLAYEVTVRTRDGDGKKWGTNTGVINDISQPFATVSGGHDGEWKMYLQFSND